jgi:hypothetical protein
VPPPELPDPLSAKARRPPGLLPAVPRLESVRAARDAETPLRTRRARQITDGFAAIAKILDGAIRTGEGFRAGAVGDTGTGKTFVLRALADAYERATGGAIVAVDDGGAAGYRGEARADLADVVRRPIASVRLVLVGDTPHGITAEAESGAALAWAISRRRRRVLLVVDELADAARGAFWRRGVERLPAAFTKGRKYGISVAWSAQQIQDVPREAFNQSDAIAVFKLVGLGLDRLAERGYLRGIDRSEIETLPGIDADPQDRGIFVLLERGRDWDRRFYRVPAG